MSRHRNPQAGMGQMRITYGNSHKDRPGGQDSSQPAAFAKIEFVTILMHTRVEGHYSGFDLILDRRKIVKKLPNNTESLKPDDSEANRFLQDLETAAANDPRIENLLQEYREYTRKK